MPRIIVEGTTSPSTFLATGHRTVADSDDPFVAKLIRRGYIRVVSPPAEEVVTEIVEKQRQVAAMERKIVHPPKRSATKAEWMGFLFEQRIAYPQDATRNELISRWEHSLGEPLGG